MLLLFWKARAPSFGTAGLSARPAATVGAVHGVVATASLGVRASATSTAVRNEVNALEAAAFRIGVRLAGIGARASATPALVQAGARLEVPATVAGHEAAQELRVRALAESLVRRGALGSLNLRGTAESLVASSPGYQLAVALRVAAWSTALGERKISPRIPMQQLAPVDLGTTYRGDTMILPVWMALTREGEPYDLSHGILHFTAKQDLVEPDAAPHVIQCSTLDGGITILDPPLGNCYRVRIEPGETQTLEGDTVFTFDVQLHTDSMNVYTIRRGLLTVVRDVTRVGS